MVDEAPRFQLDALRRFAFLGSVSRGLVRRSLLSDVSRRTRSEGLVMLTIDLIPGIEDLWNLHFEVEGKSLSERGTLQDDVGKCAQVEISLIRQGVIRDWNGACAESNSSDSERRECV